VTPPSSLWLAHDEAIAWVAQRRGFVVRSECGEITRGTLYLDIDEAGAGAERLAKERADA